MAVSQPQRPTDTLRSAQTPRSKLETPSGPKMNLFRPPTTPASLSSSYTSAMDLDSSMGSRRKRSRLDSGEATQYETPYTAENSHGWLGDYMDSPAVRSVEAASPAPFVNTQYALAGGLDTPRIAAELLTERHNAGLETDFRRRWSGLDNDGDAVGSPTMNLGEKNGRSRYDLSQGGSLTSGWSWTLLGLVGGVAGKMLRFCQGMPIPGFYAGGGKGYNLQRSTSYAYDDTGASTWEDVNESPPDYRKERASTPVPGQYPEEDAYEEVRPPAAKRMHTSDGWVMVPADYEKDSREHSPRRAERRTPNISNHSKQRLGRPSLSNSGPRRSLVPVSRRSSGLGQAGSPAIHLASRQASFSHKRSSSGVAPQTPKASGSPTHQLSPDAQKLAAQRAREEKQTDASVRKMNAQLKALIREGREALGTKYEVDVDDDMEDEGFSEGYFGAQSYKWG